MESSVKIFRLVSSPKFSRKKEILNRQNFTKKLRRFNSFRRYSSLEDIYIEIPVCTMSTLFACTRCHSRHPAEDLSEGFQLCKDCLAKKDRSATSTPQVSLTTSKCSYCRAEFPQQDEKSAKSVCKKCTSDLKNYGDPKTCEYCNLKAAFSGSKCYRCQHSEKKYGPPLPCHQCKQKCAFDKYKDPEKTHKLMCWLCILSYKRVMERTGEYHKRKAQEEGGSSKKHHKHHKHDKHEHHSHHHHHHHKHRKHEKHDKDRDSDQKHASRSGSASASGTPLTSTKAESSSEGKSREQRLAELTSGSGMESKRLKLDTAPSPSNGTTTPSRLLTDLDPSSTDHVIALQQLRDQVESLKKQLKEKDQQLMEKEKNLTELKATMYESEKILRNKIQNAQKKFDAEREDNQTEKRNLQKQISTLTKLNKNTKSGRQSTPTASP